MDDQTFARLVAEEAKNRISPSQRSLLTSKENWERWRLNLVALLENLDRQIQFVEYSRGSNARGTSPSATRAWRSRRRRTRPTTCA